jgi:hypothetical protein
VVKIYTPNNIRFRIVSSAALAQYKLDQAFDFNELINNAEYSFSQESRETLLLNYEIWFRFVCRLERILIRNEHAQEKLGILAEHISMFASDILSELDDIIQAHPTIFNVHTKTTVKKAYSVFIDYIFKVIGDTENESMYVAFPKIVTAISNSLHNLLFILHEVEHLKSKDGNYFLSFTDEAEEIITRLGTCPLILRAKLYSEMFGVTSFAVKNYSCIELDQSCVEYFKSLGFTLTGVESLQTGECAVPNVYTSAE